MAKIPSEDVLEERREILRARGVPDRFVESFSARKDVPSSKFPEALLVIGHICLALIATVAAMVTLNMFQGHIVKTQNLSVGAILFYYTELQVFAWTTPICAYMFWLISPIYTLTLHRLKPFPSANSMVSFLRELQEDEQIDGFIRPLPDHDVYAKTEKDYIGYFFRKERRTVRWGWAIVGLISLAILVAGHNRYWKVLPDRVEAYGLGYSGTYLLKNAQFVEIGCQETDDNGSRIIYRLHFKDRRFALDDVGRGLSSRYDGKYFDRLESISQQLRSQGVPFVKYNDWLLGAPMNDECIAYWSKIVKLNGDNGDTRVEKFFSLNTSKRP